MITENEHTKFHFDLATAKERAIRNAAKEIEEEHSRLKQMELADKLEIRWFIV